MEVNRVHGPDLSKQLLLITSQPALGIACRSLVATWSSAVKATAANHSLIESMDLIKTKLS